MYSRMNRISIACTLLVFSSIYQTANANIEANKATVERRVELWNTGDLAIADDIFALNFVSHVPHYPEVKDVESYKEEVINTRTTFPDFHAEIHDMVAEGNEVACRFTNHYTAPNGNTVTATGITIDHFVDGKVVEEWWEVDVMGVMEQFGMFPPTRQNYTWGTPSTVTGDPGDPETNKAILQRLFEETFRGNLNIIDELMSAEYVFHDPVSPIEVRGPEGYKQHFAMYPTAFPDIQITIDDIFAEEDQVAARWTLSGTHEGSLMGIPATGREIVMTGINIYRLADGKFVETWASYDALGMMQQLTTPEWPITGAWITNVPVPDFGNIVGQWTVSSQSQEGTNFTSIIRQAKPEATVFGLFPDADYQSDHIGQTVKTGLNTYESTLIGYGSKKAELPGMLPKVVYISVIYSKIQLVDENTAAGSGTHAFFLASADGDGDGLPDDDQEPIVCLPYSITSKRVSPMPPCIPAPVP